MSVLAGVALVASGCAAHTGPRLVGETEGIYIDVGGLRYQVQISRVLNPSDPEDAEYVANVPEGETPAADETWFGVFLRVQNTSSEPHETAEEFEIVDTQENVYEPLDVDPNLNQWVYEPVTLAPEGLIPEPDSAQFNGPTRGALLLFKLDVSTLGNRPLELEIHSPDDPDEVGRINLDV